MRAHELFETIQYTPEFRQSITEVLKQWHQQINQSPEPEKSNYIDLSFSLYQKIFDYLNTPRLFPKLNPDLRIDLMVDVLTNLRQVLKNAPDNGIAACVGDWDESMSTLSGVVLFISVPVGQYQKLSQTAPSSALSPFLASMLDQIFHELTHAIQRLRALPNPSHHKSSATLHPRETEISKSSEIEAYAQGLVASVLHLPNGEAMLKKLLRSGDPLGELRATAPGMQLWYQFKGAFNPPRALRASTPGRESAWKRFNKKLYSIIQAHLEATGQGEPSPYQSANSDPVRYYWPPAGDEITDGDEIKLPPNLNLDARAKAKKYRDKDN